MPRRAKREETPRQAARRKREAGVGAESAYTRARQHLDAEANRRNQLLGSRGHAKRILSPGTDGRKKLLEEKSVFCNAKKKDRSGARCRMPAGWGTGHLGVGACKWHGGATPTHQKSADYRSSRNQAILLGAPKEINPLDAIIWVIQIRAGEVDWLSEEIVKLEEDKWYEHTIGGRQFNLLVRARNEAMKELVNASAMAIKLGLAERAVKLAEQYGEMLASLIKGITDDLELTEEQKEKLPYIVRKRLIQVQTGMSPGELPAGVEEIVDGNVEEVAA